MPELPDLIAGRYRVGERLGVGGSAIVVRARDEVLHRQVAVKVLRDLAEDDVQRERFSAEARLLASLDHPGLVTVLDAGVDGDRPFLVLELVDGESLADVVARGPLPSTEVARIATVLAGALAHAHARGIVHRDVKPANVLLAHDGRVKLADFGIARLLEHTSHHTATGTTVGTAAYIAPEQVRGETLSPAVDVYSLGLVLVEALTGERAFPGTPTEAALRRLHHGPDVPVSLGAPWTRVLPALTDADPLRRPTAAEVPGLLTGVASDAADDERTEAVALGAVPPGVPPGVPAGADPATAVLDQVPSEPEERRRRVGLLVASAVAAVALVVLGAAVLLQVATSDDAPGGGGTDADPTSQSVSDPASDGPSRTRSSGPAVVASSAPTTAAPTADAPPAAADPGNGNVGNGDPGNGNPGNGPGKDKKPKKDKAKQDKQDKGPGGPGKAPGKP